MCNLKSNKNLQEILEYKKKVGNINFKNIEFVLFPTSIYLSFFYDTSYKIGSQNISKYQTGSYTGEILASQLKSLKVSYVLINHAETNDVLEDVIAKIKNATNENIKVILCMGEDQEQDLEETYYELKEQLFSIFEKLTKKEKENIILAYEPKWAINQKDIVHPMNIEKVSSFIKKYIEEDYQLSISVLYGGSVNEINIKNLTNMDNIDGYLLGNSANNPDKIVNILENI